MEEQREGWKAAATVEEQEGEEGEEEEARYRVTVSCSSCLTALMKAASV